MAQNANDIYTMTPGSAVADTLQSILTRQEVEKRQRMLDTVNAANVQSEIGTRQDNAATNKAYREGLIADRQAKESERQTTQGRLKALSDYASSQYPDDPVENNMWRTIEADPERGMPMYQAWMTHKLTNDSKAKPMVPARIIHYGKSNAEPVMEPATPPLLGQQPVMVPQGDPRELLHEAQPNNPPAPGAQTFIEGTDTNGNKIVLRVGPTGDPVPLKFPAGFRVGARLGIESPTKPPSPLYTTQDQNALLAAVKSNPKAAGTAVWTFAGHITDPYVKAAVLEYLVNFGQDPKNTPGVEAAAQNLAVPPGKEDPEAFQTYQDNFRTVMNIIRTSGGLR